MTRIPGRIRLRATALLTLASLSSCASPLLTPDEPRSQFDRYDAVRNQHADQYSFDRAQRRPNLEARLSVKY